MVMILMMSMNESTLDPDLAELIAEASDTYAPSQAELAAEIGVRPLALTTWRRGRSRPTAEHLRGMANALESRSERLRNLAARLAARAAGQGKLTRPRRRMPGERREADLRTAELLASRIVAEGGGRVLRVIFYGSRARGAPRSPASDWDFLVVLKDGIGDVEAEERRLKQAALSALEATGTSAAGAERDVRLDIWPIERGEWETARRLPGHTARTADREGVVLYAAG
ncbi:MAG TPA: helix-turn-helix domain-containing protein [Longimicrobium sp.]|jgi:predicted nucleotidyltransferase